MRKICKDVALVIIDVGLNAYEPDSICYSAGIVAFNVIADKIIYKLADIREINIIQSCKGQVYLCTEITLELFDA